MGTEGEKQAHVVIKQMAITTTPRNIQSHARLIVTVHGLLQARILEWVACPFSRGSSQPRDQTQVSHITDRFFTS